MNPFENNPPAPKRTYFVLLCIIIALCLLAIAYFAIKYFAPKEIAPEPETMSVEEYLWELETLAGEESERPSQEEAAAYVEENMPAPKREVSPEEREAIFRSL